MKNLKCLLVQSSLVWADAEANRQQLESLARSNAQSSDLIIFPEAFTSGFLGDIDAQPETMQGKTVAWMKSLASDLECTVCGSAVIETEKGPANRFLWVTQDGGVQFYDKRHLFSYGGEDQRYVAGNERKVFTCRGWRICPQVCYDLRFPAWCRFHNDYDVLLFVANWPEPRTSAWTALLKARAIENQCYVIGVNRAGKDKRNLIYAGASVVYDSLGTSRLDLGKGEHCGLTELDFQQLKTVRASLPFQQDADKFQLQ